MYSTLLPTIRCLFVLLIMAGGACGGSGPTQPTTPDPHADTAPTIAVAVVYDGWEIWIGNDDLVPEDDPSRAVGVLKALVTGFSKVDLGRTTPPGSLGTMIEYADKAVIRLPMGPIGNLTSDALGTQKDYYGMKGSELVRGLELAVNELEKVRAGKKILIVLSDGNDTDNEHARGQLAALKKRVRTLGIGVVSFVYKSPYSGDSNVISQLTDNTTVERTAAGLADDLARTLQHLGE